VVCRAGRLLASGRRGGGSAAAIPPSYVRPLARIPCSRTRFASNGHLSLWGSAARQLGGGWGERSPVIAPGGHGVAAEVAIY
jgi:hypothetical protein